jgi:hypothetical protein
MGQKRFKVATWYPEFLAAKPLELFVNLEDSEATFTEAHPEFENKERHPVTPAEFRKAYPEFAPDSWWDSEYVQNTDTSEDGQKLAAALMKQVEESGIDARPLTESKKAWRVVQANLREFWARRGFPLDISTLMMMLLSVYDRDDEDPPFGHVFDIDLESPYYQSLVWLNSQPWRARVCQCCHRCFIASWPSNEHCSHHCAAIALREYKREFRADHAKQYNRNRRQARAKTRNTKKTLSLRSHHAKRQNIHQR